MPFEFLDKAVQIHGRISRGIETDVEVRTFLSKLKTSGLCGDR